MADADAVIKKGNEAINKAQQDEQDAQAAQKNAKTEEEKSKAKTKEETAKKKENAAKKAVERATAAKKKTGKKAQEQIDESDDDLGRLDEIAGARDRLKNAGFTNDQIADLLEELDLSAGASDDGQVPAMKPPRMAGALLQKAGVDLSTKEGQKKLEQTAKDLSDLYKGEGHPEKAEDEPPSSKEDR